MKRALANAEGSLDRWGAQRSTARWGDPKTTPPKTYSAALAAQEDEVLHEVHRGRRLPHLGETLLEVLLGVGLDLVVDLADVGAPLGVRLQQLRGLAHEFHVRRDGVISPQQLLGELGDTLVNLFVRHHGLSVRHLFPKLSLLSPECESQSSSYHITTHLSIYAKGSGEV